MIDYRHAGVTHADLVCIGKTQGAGDIAGLQILFGLVYLAADIAAWPAYIGQEVFLYLSF